MSIADSSLKKKDNLRILRRAFKAANPFAEGKKLPTLKTEMDRQAAKQRYNDSNERHRFTFNPNRFLFETSPTLTGINCCY